MIVAFLGLLSSTKSALHARTSEFFRIFFLSHQRRSLPSSVLHGRTALNMPPKKRVFQRPSAGRDAKRAKTSRSTTSSRVPASNSGSGTNRSDPSGTRAHRVTTKSGPTPSGKGKAASHTANDPPVPTCSSPPSSPKSTPVEEEVPVARGDEIQEKRPEQRSEKAGSTSAASREPPASTIKIGSSSRSSGKMPGSTPADDEEVHPDLQPGHTSSDHVKEKPAHVLNTTGNIGTEHMRNMEAKVERRIGNVEKDVKDLKTQVTSSMSEMKGMLSTLVDGISKSHGPTLPAQGPSMSSVVDSGSKSAAGGQDSTKSMSCDIMERRIPYFDMAFSRNTLRYSLAARFFEDIRLKGKDDWLTASDALHILKTVTFGIQNSKGETREKFKVGVGLDASKFRRRVMIQALYHAQADTFNVFSDSTHKSIKEDNDDTSGKETATVDKKIKKRVTTKLEPVNKPSWLRGEKSAYIGKEDIDVAKNFHETVNGNKQSKRMAKIANGVIPTREDDATFAMFKLYTTISDMMQMNRRFFPNEYFEQVGFLFENWTKFTRCRVTKDNLEAY